MLSQALAELLWTHRMTPRFMGVRKDANPTTAGFMKAVNHLEAVSWINTAERKEKRMFIAVNSMSSRNTLDKLIS